MREMVRWSAREILKWLVSLTQVSISFLPEIILIDFYLKWVYNLEGVNKIYHLPFGLYQLITQLNDQNPNFGAGPKAFYVVHLFFTYLSNLNTYNSFV
jgi:hypothetical protein